VKQQGSPVAKRAGRTGEHHDLCVDPARIDHRAGPDEHVAAPEVILLHPDQVGRDAAAGGGHVDLLVVLLEATDANPAPARQGFQLLPHAEQTIDQGAGHDRAEAADREDPVDRQPGPLEVGADGGRGEQAVEACTKLIEALPGERRDRHQLRSRQ